MIPAEELADIRENAVSALPDIGNVVQVSRTVDGRGQVTMTTVTGPDFPCHLVPLGLAAEEAVQAGAVALVEAWSLVMPLTIIVGTEDRIGVKIEGGASSIYEVVGGMSDESLAAYRVALVRRWE